MKYNIVFEGKNVIVMKNDETVYIVDLVHKEKSCLLNLNDNDTDNIILNYIDENKFTAKYRCNEFEEKYEKLLSDLLMKEEMASYNQLAITMKLVEI